MIILYAYIKNGTMLWPWKFLRRTKGKSTSLTELTHCKREYGGGGGKSVSKEVAF